MEKPIIALSVTLGEEGMCCVAPEYLTSIWKSGGIPIIVPYTQDESVIKEIAEKADGFLFCGGVDIDPKYYREEKSDLVENICSERDELELKLFDIAIRSNKPIFGICRGLQLINVALGGTLHQHIENHRQVFSRSIAKQEVDVIPDTLLHCTVKQESILVNTFHHQCVKDLASPLVCDAVSHSDGYVEAFHHKDHPFLLGVQWHPECFYCLSQTSSDIFDAFIKACQ